MNDEQYLDHCRALLADFAREITRRAEHLPDSDPLRELATAFTTLVDEPASLYTTGPALTSRLFTTYPEIAPLYPRQLLWFFGGDCLHFMPDEEITRFQALEEARQEAASRGEVFNLRDARAKLLNLQ